MFRAIPEVSRICSMQERSRQYKLHLEALQKIKNQNAIKRAASAQNKLLNKPLRPVSLHGKAQREEQQRITYENEKMYHAIVYRTSYINRADFFEHERDHEHQVWRMTHNGVGSYGFSDPNAKKKRQDDYKFSKTEPQTTKDSPSTKSPQKSKEDENKEENQNENSTSLRAEVDKKLEPMDDKEQNQGNNQTNISQGMKPQENKPQEKKDKQGNSLSLKAEVKDEVDDVEEAVVKDEPAPANQ